MSATTDNRIANDARGAHSLHRLVRRGQRYIHRNAKPGNGFACEMFIVRVGVRWTSVIYSDPSRPGVTERGRIWKGEWPSYAKWWTPNKRGQP